MTHKDGYVSCNVCGRHESQAIILVAGQNDSHICDCCAWDCTVMIYEEVKDRYRGEESKGLIEKPTRLDVYTFADTPDDTTKNEKDIS